MAFDSSLAVLAIQELGQGRTPGNTDSLPRDRLQIETANFVLVDLFDAHRRAATKGQPVPARRSVARWRNALSCLLVISDERTEKISKQMDENIEAEIQRIEADEALGKMPE